MARLTLLFILACMSYAAASIITRWDADLLEDQSDEPEIRTIYGNDTVPWEEGEVVRIRVLSELIKDLEFNCQQNMCYGITCRKFPDKLKKNSAGAAAARKRNSCGNVTPNRCSQNYGGAGMGPKGENCDEYPFASSVQGQESTAVTIQGGKLKGITDKSEFNVRFDFGHGAVPHWVAAKQLNAGEY
ncbi:hypothetical protein FOMPIDRAFT_1017194 [Fomitopsis schrenkii]|uniref:Deoxyribonuclease NucA/NucB domain-containing protein n=1 Tax=Fomitopsis schrenkii TaxID=2126942 RepID=S8FCK0_FOMSC|nr:hypothetical protein FOMPIDRAFT_1017194 [Fomitopsis schrenkii]